MLKQIQEMTPKLGRHNAYTKENSLFNRPEQNPNIYGVLDTNQLFLEFIAFKEPKDDIKKGIHQKYYQVLVVSITHRTTSLTFDIGGQNQNLPFGTNDIKIRGYAWTKEQFEMYLRKKEDVEFDILEALYDSMKEVREQIETYLKEEIDVKYAEELKRKYPDYYPEKTVTAFKSFKDNMFALSSFLGPFKFVLLGFKAGFSPILNIFTFNPKEKKDKDIDEFKETKNYKEVKDELQKHTFSVYDIYKRANKLTVW